MVSCLRDNVLFSTEVVVYKERLIFSKINVIFASYKRALLSLAFHTLDLLRAELCQCLSED